MAVTAASRKIEQWLIARGHLSEPVELQDYEVSLESDYDERGSLLKAGRYGNLWGNFQDNRPRFDIEVRFNEDELIDLITFAIGEEK